MWHMQIRALFDWLVDPCIAFVRRNCKEVVPTADVNLPVSLMNLFSSLLDGFRPDAAGQPPVSNPHTIMPIQCCRWLYYSACTVCCALPGS